MNELATFKAVAQARQDIAEGIDTHTAVRSAARRYNVDVATVTAYTTCALAGCRKAALELKA